MGMAVRVFFVFGGIEGVEEDGACGGGVCFSPGKRDV